MIKTPIFLVGAERSGTTLLRLMLDHHPHIAFHYEFEFAVDQISETGQYPDLSSYLDYLSDHRIFLASQFEINDALTYPELVNSFLLQRQQRVSKPIVGATVHHYFDKLPQIWPQAKFIHLIRDGRDVARSNMPMGWAGNLFVGADRWIEAEAHWKKLVTQLSPEQHISVYYEPLIKNPEVILKQLCVFIGVDFDQSMFEYAEKSTYSKPDVSITERWRKLPPKDLQLAECKIADLLQEHGYPLSGLPLIPVTRWLNWRMRIHDRWKRILFRIRRYSLRLYLADVISRRLGFKQWQKRVKQQLNARDEQYLK